MIRLGYLIMILFLFLSLVAHAVLQQQERA